MQARLCQWEADFDFIGQYNAGFLAYCRALYGLRHPIGELPPTPAHNTPEEDIAMMGATTLGTASPVGDGSDLLMVGK